MLLVTDFGWLMVQAKIMILIGDGNGLKEREDFEVSDDFVDLEVGDLKGSVVSVDGEDSDDLFLARKIKGVLFFAILEVLDDFAVTELGEFEISYSFVIECDLIASHNCHCR